MKGRFLHFCKSVVVLTKNICIDSVWSGGFAGIIGGFYGTPVRLSVGSLSRRPPEVSLGMSEGRCCQ